MTGQTRDAFFMVSTTTWEEFVARYEPWMARAHTSTGSTLLKLAAKNGVPEVRVRMMDRLLEDGADAGVVGSGDHTNVLHVFLYRSVVRHPDRQLEADLVGRLIDAGADPNQRSPKFGPVLQSLFWLRVPPPERGPYYDAFFDRPGLRFDVALAGGKLDLFESFSQARLPGLRERFVRYLERFPESLPEGRTPPEPSDAATSEEN